MFTLLHGVPWVHCTPALIAVVFGLLYLKTEWVYLKVLWCIFWLLLIPNTAYIFADLERLALHMNSVSTEMRVALILQYICLEIIGLATFLLAFLPFESIIRMRHFSQEAQVRAVIMFNFLIGFGMVIGRTGHTNSYVVFTQPVKVLIAAAHIVTSSNLLGLAVFFGMLCNGIYFLFRNMLIRHAKMFL